MLTIADQDRDGSFDLAVFEGASSGLLGDDDIDEAGTVAGGRIPLSDIESTLNGSKP